MLAKARKKLRSVIREEVSLVVRLLRVLFGCPFDILSTKEITFAAVLATFRYLLATERWPELNFHPAKNATADFSNVLANFFPRAFFIRRTFRL